MKLKRVLSVYALIVLITACGDYAPQLELPGLLGRIRTGEPMRHKNLTVVPLFSDVKQKNVEYVTLEQALEQKLVEITETDQGQVPKVLINNKSDKRIFIMSGQVITGCKQDRIIAGDLIIEPSAKDIDMDVFCVESGRWSSESGEFTSKENLGTARLRNTAQSKDEIAQMKIWNEIAAMNRNNDVETRTNAYQDIYETEKVKRDLEEFDRALNEKLDKDAVGIIVAVGSKIVSVDIFKNSDMLLNFWPQLLKSSALYAVDARAGGSISVQDVEAFLHAVRDKEYIKNRSKNEKACTYTYMDDTLNISAHMYDGVLIHLSGFPVDEDSRITREEHCD